MDPSVSVPMAASTSPAAPAAALPDEEPHGLRSSANGLWVWPPTALQPEIEALERMFAHSDKFVFPKITASEPRKRATRGRRDEGRFLIRPILRPSSAKDRPPRYCL